MRQSIFYLFTLFLFGVLLLFSGCKKDLNNEESVEVQLNPRTLIADERTKNDLISIDSVSLTFKGNSPQINDLKEGDILVSDITNVANFGYLRKIISVDSSGSSVLLKTSEVAIAEAIESGSGNYSKKISIDDIYDQDTSGIELARKNPVLKFEINKSFNLDGGSSNDGKIKFTGSVDLSPEVEYKFAIKKHKVEHFLIKFKFSNNSKLKVKYGYKVKKLGINKTWVLKTIRLKPITVFVGNFPVVLDQRIVFVAGLDGDVKVELVAEATNSYSSELGLEYNLGIGWTTINNQENNLTGDIELEGVASIEGWLQPRYEIRPYGINAAKASLSAKVSVKAEAVVKAATSSAYPATLEASLKFIGKFLGKAQMQVFSTSVVDYDYEFWSMEYLIKKWTTDYTPIQTDPDGYSYGSIKLGNQNWITENYRYGGIRWENKADYGGYYRNSVGSNLPENWRLPTSDEFQILIDTLGSNAFNILTSKSGFNAKPFGYIRQLIHSNYSDFENIEFNKKAVFLSSTGSNYGTVASRICLVIDYDTQKVYLQDITTLSVSYGPRPGLWTHINVRLIED